MRAKNILHPHARVSVRAPATQFSIPLTLEDDEKTGFGGDQPFVTSRARHFTSTSSMLISPFECFFLFPFKHVKGRTKPFSFISEPKPGCGQ